ncbi:MAG: hypothetical protein JWN48_473 [Myxococcaceae bacterium]|nr:hypothetical protein [Myxococcaceae bacterium]
MARHVFYSLHYQADRSRAELVRNLSALSPNLEAKPAEWATLQRKGEFAIKHWFEQQLRGRSCTIVLIGAETVTRPLVLYEIKRSWELKLGLLGVHIHNLKDAQGAVSRKGASPFEAAGLGAQASLIQTFDPPESDTKLAYRYIADHLAAWVEHAVAERAKHP